MLTIAILTINISSCELNPSKKQKLNIDVKPDSIIEDQPFNPSHTTLIDLIKREDGYFNVPVEINYRDPEGKIWIAPVGTITDGASIPSLFESFFGGKLNKDFLFAAILHDAYCAIANENATSYHTERWEDTHHMFYKACINNGTDITTAGIMYAAVRLGGPRWPFQNEPYINIYEKVEDSILIKEMKECKDWIISKGDTLKLKHIDEWMDEREKIFLKEN
ncbi:DUF1353 domain-containing protein [Abyssalbus ytuae]|uniref:DUF1353 domain-containing protein n=1 Tax=Abyssalbus ytuae TaxID=2926907 RepID=A0A9E6ZU10_9FLAO|nr:DUF1353 domain-containing protein [Abyssalbus ytuae]UOB16696.1 DUF1353 domain-containing protein [Abyssalbus ytuae]